MQFTAPSSNEGLFIDTAVDCSLPSLRSWVRIAQIFWLSDEKIGVGLPFIGGENVTNLA